MNAFRITRLAVVLAVIAATSAARHRAPQLYRADDRSAGDQVVLVSGDPYGALYSAADAADERLDDYAPRASSRATLAPRQKEAPRQPPVQTIRNYNKVNDDGSFTFGYEAADGSFKEETRGTDCVVRGKYGYVDPDGNKREFTYVSGNPCDPNAPDEEAENAPESNEAEDNEPANYPTRPAQQPQHRLQPTTQRAPTTYFQNNYRNEAEAEEEEESEEEPLQHIRQPVQQIIRRPAIQQHRIARPTPQRIRPEHPQSYSPQNVAITPRPQLASVTFASQPPATTFRPQLLQLTPRPQIAYSPVLTSTIAATQAPIYQTTPRPGQIDFAAEFAKFQRENQISSPTAATLKTQTKVGEPPAPSGTPIYSTELVYDPSSGSYNSQLYQSLPQTKGEFNLDQRLQPYVAQQQSQPRPFIPSQQVTSPPSAPLFRHQIQHGQSASVRNPQEAYQRQQSELQYQNSAQLFAQQQQLQASQLHRDRQAARVQAQQLGGRAAQQQPLQQQQQQQQPQQFYYVSPQRLESSGQIDAFLRGHGIQF